MGHRGMCCYCGRTAKPLLAAAARGWGVQGDMGMSGKGGDEMEQLVGEPAPGRDWFVVLNHLACHQVWWVIVLAAG